MPYQYSQQLIADYQKYFLERFNKEISVSQANEYLHSTTGLFLLYAFPPNDSKAIVPRSTGRNDCQIATHKKRGSQSLSVISIKHTPTPKI